MSPRAAWRLESLGFTEVYDYVAGKQDWLASGLPTEGPMARIPRAGTVAREDVPTCELDERLSEVRERTKRAGFETCVVVNEERVVLGILRDEEFGKDDGRVEDVMRPGPSTFRPHVEIEELAGYMQEHEMRDAPITTGEGRLIGLLLREDAEAVAHRLHAALHEHEEYPADRG